MGKQQKRSTTRKKGSSKRPSVKQQLDNIERKLPKSKRRKKLIPNKRKTRLA